MNTDSNINQELEEKKDDEQRNEEMKEEPEFIIKRTEAGDIFYFMEPIIRETTDEGTIQNYLDFFHLTDIEIAYENSEFSITVIDQKNDNQIVAIFIFNNTPFSPIKKDNIETNLMLHPGLWEGWFNDNFNETKLNGTNSAWLIFYCIDPSYCKSEETLKQIFLKIHLSFYTTLSKYSNVLFLLSKDTYGELDNYELPQNDAEITPQGTTKIMLNFMYEFIEEIKEDKKDENKIVNAYHSFKNQRSSVVPTIELRIGLEQDHDDLENIFKEQTPPETVNQLEDFFIAKMIAAQNDTDKVLVGQVNDKAIGMLAVSTDVNVDFLVKNFELEGYDNLLKQDYMEAVNLKRKMILSEKEKKADQEMKDLEIKYEKEVKKCEVIFQRLRLQLHVNKVQKRFEGIENYDKIFKKEMKTKEVATQLIFTILKGFEIETPDLEQFKGKIQIKEGECILSSEFDFLLETLEYFGLEKGYMDGAGHWKNFLAQLEQKNQEKAQFRKKLGNTGRSRANAKGKKNNDDEYAKPTTFDFIPLGDALKLLMNSNISIRTALRNIIRTNKSLIASFFVDENGEPSDERCFDINSLYKKLVKAKVAIPDTFEDKIAPILICFGDLHYNKRVVQRAVEKEQIAATKKKEKKTKAVKKKVVKEEVKQAEVKIENVTLYEVSISEFFKAVDKTFDYDKLLYELKEIDDPDFIEEYNSFKKAEEEKYLASLIVEKTEYEKIRDANLAKNSKDSDALQEKYKEILANYNDENEIPPTPNEVLNAFCVKLFFIEQAFESRSSDFLMQAFDQFPDKDYLVLTQPHSYIENSLLENFIKIDKKVDSTFGEVLYIIHRESLMISLLKVDYATEADLKNGCYLFEQLNDPDYMYSLALHTIQNPENSKFMCVVAKINDHIIGICLLSKEANVDYYDSHFSIRDYINLDKISKYVHSRIVFFSSHRNFAQYTKIFLKEILRLVNKICLYYEITPDEETTPKFFKDFILSRNRKFPHFQMKGWEYQKELYEDEKIKTRLDGEERDELDEKESDFCLLYLSKKMMLESRIANNNRIVIVGASDTGISFIESLLSIRYLEFSYIYLIAPGALLYHHIEDEINNMKVSINNYQLKDLKKLLLEHRIKIINSKVIDIKPKQKYIQFEDYSILNYDYLVLTVGLQDHLWIDFREVCSSSMNEKFAALKETLDNSEKFDQKNSQQNVQALYAIRDNNNAIIKSMIFSIDDPNIYEKFSITDSKVISLRKNSKYEILLYGRSLNLVCFIQGLLKRRVPPHKIKLVIPTLNYDLTVNKPGEKEKKLQNAKKAKGEVNILDDDLEIVNGNNLEDCPEVQQFIIGVLEKKGIKVYKNFNFVGVKLKREAFSEDICQDAKSGTGPTLKEEMNDKELGVEAFKFQGEGEEEPQELTASLIVTGGMLDVDPEVFKFIHENGLVYNGRAMINNNFLTANENIFAAGRLCEFSKCYSYIEKHKQLKLESYNSQEVGYTLAKYFLQTIDSQLNVDSSAFDDKKLPSFFLPLPLGCYLPDDYVLYKAQNVKETNPKIYERNKNREGIVYNTLDQEGGCYLKFDFDIFGIISSVVYFGKEKIDYRALISLVGLHETYLNKLLVRYQGEQGRLVDNIPEFLSENWALAVYHDKFAQLVIKLKTILQEQEIQEIVANEVGRDDNKEEGKDSEQRFAGLNRNRIKEILAKVPKRSRSKIEREIVTFLNENRNQLPFYHIPKINFDFEEEEKDA